MLNKIVAGAAIMVSSQMAEVDGRVSILESLKVQTPQVERKNANGVDLRCTSTVDRLKRGPADWKAIIEKNSRRKYTDRDFRGVDQYYKLPWSGWSAWEDYWMYGYGYYFQRLGEKYPDATLFGSDGVPNFSDVEGQ